MRARALFFVLALAAAFALGFWFKGFLLVDRCLDHGGRWNQQDATCEGIDRS
jgi:hypothetical protein